MNEEKRKKPRVNFQTQIILKVDGKVIETEANSKDISIKGVFIDTEKKVSPGSRCDIEILLTGTSSRLALAMKGVIARQDPYGLGIEFDSMDIDSFFHLKNIVSYNTSDPKNFETERQSSSN